MVNSDISNYTWELKIETEFWKPRIILEKKVIEKFSNQINDNA